MKLRQLFENVYEQTGEEFDGSLKTVGVCFGRWNPPHKGHKAVWQAASKNPIWYVGTNQSTSGPKDPLPYDIKLQCMAAVWPAVAQHVIPEQSLLTLASRIYEKHGGNVHLKVYTDEEWLYKALSQYNGVEKDHGMYKFIQIDWVRTERLASATNLRAAVRAGDRKSFYHDMGIKPSITVDVGDQQLPVFDVVAHYLNQYPEKVKKVVAELSSETLGRYKKAAHADAKKADAEGDYARGDKRFKGINTATRKQFDNDLKKHNQYEVNESHMGTLEIEIEEHLSRQLAAFKAGRLDADYLGEYCVRLGKILSKKHGIGEHWIADIINDYVEDQLGDSNLNEAKQSKMSPRQNQSTKGANLVSDGEHWNGDYTMYRLGMAVAGTDGQIEPDIDASSWIGKYKSTHPYSKEEQDMLKKAYKAVGAKYKDLNKGDMRSLELDSTNKTSPVAKRKKNKYGV